MDRVTGPRLSNDVLAASEYGRSGLSLDSEARQASAAFVVAHEMGLVLGLGEQDCTAANPHLMCAQSEFQNAGLSRAECAQAREGAQPFVKAKWGVSVAP